jgi:polysaccharide biosynthesis/export protein
MSDEAVLKRVIPLKLSLTPDRSRKIASCRRVLLRGVSGFCLFGLAACGFVPRDTPTAETIRGDAIVAGGNAAHFRYALVDLNDALLKILNDSAFTAASLGHLPAGPSATRSFSISPGDILAITVFESASGGIFNQQQSDQGAARTGATSTIPNQQVNANGDITVPFAGQVHVAGLTPEKASVLLESRLAKRALEPQVIVSVTERRSGLVSVLGDVSTPTRFAIDPGGITLLEAIARSGGTRGQGYETIVVLQRGGREYRSMLSSVVHNPSQNVQLAGGDVIFLSKEPQFVTIFGALSEASGGQQNTKRVSFDGDVMSMSEALAKVNGLSDVRADPSKVFILRSVSKSALRRMGVDVSPFASEMVPTVFSINLKQTEGLFVANHLAMQNRDVIVAVDATYTDVTKLVTLFDSAIVQPTNTAATVVTAVNTTPVTSVTTTGLVVK